jgi:hypothetical protein
MTCDPTVRIYMANRRSALSASARSMRNGHRLSCPRELVAVHVIMSCDLSASTFSWRVVWVDVAVDLVVMLVDGGEAIVDLAVLRTEEAALPAAARTCPRHPQRATPPATHRPTMAMGRPTRHRVRPPRRSAPTGNLSTANAHTSKCETVNAAATASATGSSPARCCRGPRQ